MYRLEGRINNQILEVEGLMGNFGFETQEITI